MTFDLEHFPAARLAPHDVEAQHPDEFVRHAIDLAPAQVLRTIREQAAATRKPALSELEVAGRLEACGLATTATKLRELLAE